MRRMDYNAVFDISSIIWDEKDFDSNSYQYYKLLYGVSIFLERINVNNILMRKQLSYELINEFPFKKIKNLEKYGNTFKDIGQLIYRFIGKINLESKSYTANCDSEINILPNIIKSHFNENVKSEICYLFTKIHSENENSSTYFTFKHLWSEEDNLKTITEDKTNTYETIIADNGNDLNDFFEKFKPKFEHNPKHDRIKSGEYASSLSCFNGSDNSVPQDLLDSAFEEQGVFYNFDKNNKVWVVFRQHSENENFYHGYDENNENKIPNQIRKKLNKI